MSFVKLTNYYAQLRDCNNVIEMREIIYGNIIKILQYNLGDTHAIAKDLNCFLSAIKEVNGAMPVLNSVIQEMQIKQQLAISKDN